MNDFQEYGPPAWAAAHGGIAIQAIDALLKLDRERDDNPELDVGPGIKEIATLIDGEYLPNAAYPSIFLASRTTISLGQPKAVGIRRIEQQAIRNQLVQAREIIEKGNFRSDPDYSSGQSMALYLLYHLRIMQIARAGGIVARASKIDPERFETHILADTFAAVELTRNYRNDKGLLNRDSVLSEHNDFRRTFNLVHCKYEADEFSLEDGAITIKGSLPSILLESLVDQRVDKVCDHYLMNDNQAKVTKVTAANDTLVISTNARNSRNLQALEYAPFRI